MAIGGHLRRYVTKLFPRSASFSTSPQAQAQPPLNSRPLTQPPPLITPSEVAVWVVLGGGCHAFLKWLSFQIRDKLETQRSEKVMQKRLEEMDRKKKESPEAYLGMLHREIRTMMFELSISEELPAWKSEHYGRKAALLESKLHEWIHGEEDTAPVPQG